MLPCFHEMFLKFTSIDSNSGFEVPEVVDYKRHLIQITNELFRLVYRVLDISNVVSQDILLT